MNRTAIDLWVGIFVTIGLAAIVFLALKVGNLTSLNTAPSYRLEARFDNIGGLKMRAPVKAAGVVVGRVDNVRLDPKTYEAVVALKIDNGYQFTKDSIASILTSGLLGEVYVGIEAGGDRGGCCVIAARRRDDSQDPIGGCARKTHRPVHVRQGRQRGR
jgi:phospholipid/cholesterol/gamma-HCH transport system substrate-binding protein